MGTRASITAERDAAQAKLNALNRLADDTFSIGTVVVFAAGTSKWHYLKVAEETWRQMATGLSDTKDLAGWVLNSIESDIGYFEVYELRVQPTPFYASS